MRMFRICMILFVPDKMAGEVRGQCQVKHCATSIADPICRQWMRLACVCVCVLHETEKQNNESRQSINVPCKQQATYEQGSCFIEKGAYKQGSCLIVEEGASGRLRKRCCSQVAGT